MNNRKYQSVYQGGDRAFYDMSFEGVLVHGYRNDQLVEHFRKWVKVCNVNYDAEVKGQPISASYQVKAKRALLQLEQCAQVMGRKNVHKNIKNKDLVIACLRQWEHLKDVRLWSELVEKYICGHKKVSLMNGGYSTSSLSVWSVCALLFEEGLKRDRWDLCTQYIDILSPLEQSLVYGSLLNWSVNVLKNKESFLGISEYMLKKYKVSYYAYSGTSEQGKPTDADYQNVLNNMNDAQERWLLGKEPEKIQSWMDQCALLAQQAWSQCEEPMLDMSGLLEEGLWKKMYAKTNNKRQVLIDQLSTYMQNEWGACGVLLLQKIIQNSYRKKKNGRKNLKTIFLDEFGYYAQTKGFVELFMSKASKSQTALMSVEQYQEKEVKNLITAYSEEKLNELEHQQGQLLEHWIGGWINKMTAKMPLKQSNLVRVCLSVLQFDDSYWSSDQIVQKGSFTDEARVEPYVVLWLSSCFEVSQWYDWQKTLSVQVQNEYQNSMVLLMDQVQEVEKPFLMWWDAKFFHEKEQGRQVVSGMVQYKDSTWDPLYFSDIHIVQDLKSILAAQYMDRVLDQKGNQESKKGTLRL